MEQKKSLFSTFWTVPLKIFEGLYLINIKRYDLEFLLDFKIVISNFELYFQMF